MNIDLRTDLPKVRAAFDTGKLQAQDPNQIGATCRYSGPCAVGVMLPEPIEPARDGHSVSSLLRSVLSAPEEQHPDLYRLQDAHDAMMSTELGIRDPAVAKFPVLLAELEAKYAR